MRQSQDQVILFNAASADGATSASRGNVLDFRHVIFQLAMVGYTGTIKFVGSNADTAPDFSSAATAANPWDYIKCINLIDGSSVNGGTGVTGAATTSITQLEANTNGFKWMGAIMSGTSAGTLTLKSKGYGGGDE